MVNVSDASDARSVALLLTTMYRLHKQLADFTTRLYIAFDFGLESGLMPTIRIEERPAGPELRLHHCFAFCAEGDPDVSELRFSASVTAASAGCAVEALVDVALDQPRGGFGASVHTLHLERMDRLPLDDALGWLEAQVAVMCTMGDIPGRLGFQTR